VISIVVFLIYQPTYSKKKLIKIFMYIMIIFVSVLSILYITPTLGYDNMVLEDFIFRTSEIEKKLDTFSQSGRYVGRLGIWNHAIQIFMHTTLMVKLVGNGGGEAMALMGYSTHNGFLKLLLEYGIISILLLLSLMFELFKGCARTSMVNASSSYIISLLTFILLKNMTNSHFPGATFLGTVFILIMIMIFAQEPLKNKMYKIT